MHPDVASPFKPDADYAELLAWLRARQNVLVVTHPRPDGDAFGSLFGAWRLLQSLGIAATPYVPEDPAARFLPYAPDSLIIGGDLPTDRFDSVLCLDAARADRVATPGAVLPSHFGLPVANVDHHIDNPNYGDFNLVDPACAATCEMLARLCMTQGLSIDADTASSLLIGVLTDTGGLRYLNTSPATLQAVAWLQESGADYHRVMREFFMTESWDYLRLKASLVEKIVFAADRRIAILALSQDTLDAFGVDNRDTEDLIDVARNIEGVLISCRLQPVAEGVRVSLRSASPDLPVIEIAQSFGGGGHTVAAGATAQGMNLADVQARILQLAEEMIRGRTS